MGRGRCWLAQNERVLTAHAGSRQRSIPRTATCRRFWLFASRRRFFVNRNRRRSPSVIHRKNTRNGTKTGGFIRPPPPQNSTFYPGACLRRHGALGGRLRRCELNSRWVSRALLWLLTGGCSSGPYSGCCDHKQSVREDLLMTSNGRSLVYLPAAAALAPTAPTPGAVITSNLSEKIYTSRSQATADCLCTYLRLQHHHQRPLLRVLWSQAICQREDLWVTSNGRSLVYLPAAAASAPAAPTPGAVVTSNLSEMVY